MQQGKKFKVVVLVKQVPDTRCVGRDAMTPEGTVNRAALPAIFNPEDLKALEQALRIKDCVKGCEVVALTMGPARAVEILRDSIFRGADKAVLLTDRKFAGADTLATSYALSEAIRKIGADVVVAGRQAIDGDTAQVGPQVAEKLGLPQVTYVDNIEGITPTTLTLNRRLAHGTETVEVKLPAVITVTESAPDCREQNTHRVLRYKYACTPSEAEKIENPIIKARVAADDTLCVEEWGVATIGCEECRTGLAGSPTKVKHVESIVFQAKESKVMGSTDDELNSFMVELLKSRALG